MKKIFVAVATALLMSMGFTACGGDHEKAAKAVEELEAIVEKMENVDTEDFGSLSKLLEEFTQWGDKYGDLSESDFTAEQKAKIDELEKRMGNLE